MRLRPRHLRRYRQITGILVDYGFGAILAQLGLSERLNIPRRVLRRKPAIEEELNQAQRLRLALEELGPTFIKMGQILSTRADLLPPDVIDELRLLQDRVPPGPWEPIRELIELELGAPIQELFAHIDHNALAAASLAQVHAAVLPRGEEVVVKALRPDIEIVINLDLDILSDLAQLAQERTALGERYDVVDFAAEFAISLQGELDFRREGRSADQFRENFAKEPHLKVPIIYWDYSTRRILVQEQFNGIKIDDIAALDTAGYDCKQLADIAARFVLKEVMEDGFFHADPHPGNLLVLPGEVLGVLDFGAVGRLGTNDRVSLARLLILVVQNDVEGIVDQLMRMGIADFGIDRTALVRALNRLLMKYYGLPIQEIPATEVSRELEPIVYKYKLRIPSNYLLLIKTIAIMQGVGLGLDPEFDMFAFTRPYLNRLFRQLLLPSTWGPGFMRMLTDWGDLVSGFPGRTTRILGQLERGDLGFEVDVPQVDDVVDRVDRIANRIIYGVLLSAFIVALALLIPNMDLTWPWGIINWIIIVGFLVISALGLQLLWSIFRSGKPRKKK
ncbi:MAG TPA: AarF/ABC1/UbiB kinase family protein [Anaerolineales bacterium]|nr:AarF/ABC1/UbiB kinase family protein [Anaerolineales bacterium]